MTERFGDSTRAVKATASGRFPRGAGDACPGIGIGISPISGGVAANHTSMAGYGNPTCHQLESARLEEQHGGTGIPVPGMAAITTALRAVAAPVRPWWFPPTATIRRRFAVEYLEPVGVTVIRGVGGPRCARSRLKPTLFWSNRPPIPASTLSTCTGLAAICRSQGARLLVDNTTATPFGQQPLSLGADLVVASATKVVSGHSDLLAGYVAGSQPELMAALERGAVAGGPDTRCVRGLGLRCGV